jgi:carbamoyl-phosphate synthase small subunit
MQRVARLCLADGTEFSGRLAGPPLAASGEVVFTTGMTGYQEVLTDPSFAGQIVVMTAPQIGNTGVNRLDPESAAGRPHVAALVVRDASPVTSSWRADASMEAYLAESGVPLLSDVDTRRLTRHLRDHGSQNGAVGSEDAATLVDRARAAPSMAGLELARRVTCAAPYRFEERSPSGFAATRSRRGSSAHIVALDLGIKRNILRTFADLGCRVTVVPATFGPREILALEPDGVFVSNGPGDPAATTYAVDTVRGLLGERPLFGICLGHQILALALGAHTYKLKFGHRGLNHPVLDHRTGRIEITLQNHGFAVDPETLPARAAPTHSHLNDGTSEGIEVPDARAFSVQFHPEAAAGPHDTLHLFDRFLDLAAPGSA